MITLVRKKEAPQYQDVNDLGFHPETTILSVDFGIKLKTKTLYITFVTVVMHSWPSIWKSFQTRYTELISRLIFKFVYTITIKNISSLTLLLLQYCAGLDSWCTGHIFPDVITSCENLCSVKLSEMHVHYKPYVKIKYFLQGIL